MRRGLLLALLVHVLLVAGLAVGVNWRASNPQGMQAELWAAVPQVAAPRAATAEQPPARPPEPAPPPKASAKKAPPAPAVEPETAPPPRKAAPDPQIALEKARREERERRLESERDDERLRKEEAAKKLAARKLELAKAEAAAKALQAEKAAREKVAAEAQKAAELDKEKKRKEQELRLAKLAEAKEQAEANRIAEQREEALRRMLSQAGGGSGEVGSKGSAAQNAAPSDGYAGRVKARIKPNIVFVDQLASNPEAEVLVRLAPDGRIISQKLERSSGSKEWDAAVQRAIDRTEVLPRDVDGRVPSSMLITFRPRE